MTDSTQNGYENAVFVSYAWGGESERTVDELEQAFAARGLRIVRDKKDLGYKGSIEAFEQRIGRGQCVVLVISDKYLRSKDCMYELVEVKSNRNLQERIFPIVLQDARLYKPVERLEYIRYWDDQIQTLNQALKTTEQLTGLQGIIAELEKYRQIRDHFDSLTAQLSDMNALTPELHAGEGYATVIEKVTQVIAGTGTAPRASARRDADRRPATDDWYAAPDASATTQSSAPHLAAAPRSASAPRLAAAPLTLTLSADPNPAPVDADVTWTATARNPGAAPAHHLELLRGKNWLHEEESFDLPPGGERAFILRRSYANPGDYSETVRLLSSAAPVEALGRVRVVQPAGFSLRLAASAARLVSGEEVTWTLEVYNDGGEGLQQVRLRLGSELLGEPFDLPRGEKKVLSFGRTYLQPGEVVESVRAAAFIPVGERLARQVEGKVLVAAPPPKTAPLPAQAGTPVMASEPLPAAKTVEEQPLTLRLTLAPGVFLDLQHVPAGEFLMGGDPTKDSRADLDEQPQHKVYLDEYFIGKYPVTVAQFAAFTKATSYQTTAEKKGSGRGWTGSQCDEIQGASWQFPHGPGTDVEQKADHPVTQVSWEDAAAFCAWASEAAGRKLRLPTEAEWEKAARGTDERVYPWGEVEPDAERCNFEMNVQDTTPVGKYSPQGDSPYGCADMAGNVWEWCRDWYAKEYYASSPAENPAGTAFGKSHALRGGSWYGNGYLVRVSSRGWDTPTHRNSYLGFRCAFSP